MQTQFLNLIKQSVLFTKIMMSMLSRKIKAVYSGSHKKYINTSAGKTKNC